MQMTAFAGQKLQVKACANDETQAAPRLYSVHDLREHACYAHIALQHASSFEIMHVMMHEGKRSTCMVASCNEALLTSTIIMKMCGLGGAASATAITAVATATATTRAPRMLSRLCIMGE
jgi:hypothetical protein